METNEKPAKQLGFTFGYKRGRVLIYKSTLEAIGYPEFYRFRLEVPVRHFATAGSSVDAVEHLIGVRKS